MATELPRPGVEVVQEFQSASPTIVTPTLVPCNVAPFFEVIEALDNDGNLNDDAKLVDTYQQLELTVGERQGAAQGCVCTVDRVGRDVQQAGTWGLVDESFASGGGALEQTGTGHGSTKGLGLPVREVRLWETEKSCASYAE